MKLIASIAKISAGLTLVGASLAFPATSADAAPRKACQRVSVQTPTGVYNSVRCVVVGGGGPVDLADDKPYSPKDRPGTNGRPAAPDLPKIVWDVTFTPGVFCDGDYYLGLTPEEQARIGTATYTPRWQPPSNNPMPDEATTAYDERCVLEPIAGPNFIPPQVSNEPPPENWYLTAAGDLGIPKPDIQSSYNAALLTGAEAEFVYLVDTNEMGGGIDGAGFGGEISCELSRVDWDLDGVKTTGQSVRRTWYKLGDSVGKINATAYWECRAWVYNEAGTLYEEVFTVPVAATELTLPIRQIISARTE